jgi:purine-binding chemotaxis protein CheW
MPLRFTGPGRGAILPAGTVSSVGAAEGTSLPREAQWVVFVCDERRYGFPLERVSEILTPRAFTRLPGAGPEVCGLVGVHGRVITVVDLGRVLGLRPAITATEHRLLLVELNGRPVGVVVEWVAAIARARVTRQDAVRDEAVLGTGQTDEGEFTALEPDRLLHALMPT